MSKKHISISPGNTWTANHCSHDRSLDAGGSVRGAVSSPALLHEIREKSTIEGNKLSLYRELSEKLIKIC